MNDYNLKAQEVTKLIELYVKIPTLEQRIFAQGYLNGLAAAPKVPTITIEKRCQKSLYKQKGGNQND